MLEQILLRINLNNCTILTETSGEIIIHSFTITLHRTFVRLDTSGKISGFLHLQIMAFTVVCGNPSTLEPISD